MHHQRPRRVRRRHLVPRMIRQLLTLTVLGAVLTGGYTTIAQARLTQVKPTQDATYAFERDAEMYQHKLAVEETLQQARVQAEKKARLEAAEAQERARVAALEQARINAQRNYEQRTMIVSRGGPRDLSDFRLLLPDGVEDSGITAAQLNTVVADTSLAGIGTFCKAAEQKHHIRADALCAMAIHESGWGKSELARERNNLFGFGAPTSDPDQAVRFSSKEDSINEAAEWLTAQYLTPGGNYYRGGTLAAIGPIWAEDNWEDGDPSWAWKVSDTWTTVLRRIHQGG